MEYINGMKVIVSNGPAMVKSHCKQFRFPRSRKKRIQNKWSKQANNFKTIIDEYLAYHDRIQNAIIVHPEIYKQLKELKGE